MQQSLLSPPRTEENVERPGGGVLGFLLTLASLLGGGIFFLPEAVESLSLGGALAIILGCGIAFALTTVVFAAALDRYLDSVDDVGSSNFIGSMLEARLGRRPARLIGFFMLAQSLLLLYGYVHEVTGRSASVLGTSALAIAAVLALIVFAQQRGTSITASINSALVLAALNAIALGALLILVNRTVDIGAVSTPPRPLSVAPVVMGISFSFSLLYGHIGAASAVVAGRERSMSRRRVHGGLAAGVMIVSMVLAATVVLHRSIPVPNGQTASSFLDRLELLDSPVLAIFAGLYLVGQLTLQAIHTSLGITLLSRDWLANSRGITHPPSLAAIPAIAVIMSAGLSAHIGFGGYDTALALSGVILVPLLGGCVPVLIRYQEAQPVRVQDLRVLAAMTSVVFLLPTIAHGLVVWPGLLHRSLIGLTLVLTTTIMTESLKDSAVGRLGRFV